MQVNKHSGSIFKGISNIVSTGDLRPMLTIAIIDGGNIVATDANQLVIVNLKAYDLSDEDINHLEGKCLDKETLQKLGTLKNNQEWFINEQGFNIIKANGKVGLIYPLTSHKDEGTYPNYKAVLPKESSRGAVDYISFNPKYLINLQNVHLATNTLNNDLKLSFNNAPNKPIVVTNEDKNFYGLFIPIKILY